MCVLCVFYVSSQSSANFQRLKTRQTSSSYLRCLVYPKQPEEINFNALLKNIEHY